MESSSGFVIQDVIAEDVLNVTESKEEIFLQKHGCDLIVPPVTINTSVNLEADQTDKGSNLENGPNDATETKYSNDSKSDELLPDLEIVKNDLKRVISQGSSDENIGCCLILPSVDIKTLALENSAIVAEGAEKNLYLENQENDPTETACNNESKIYEPLPDLKIEKNYDFLTNMLTTANLKEYIINMDATCYKEVPADNFPGYQNILLNFKTSYYTSTMTSMVKVLNPYLRLLYELKKKELMLKYTVRELDLYHGTRIENLSKISSNNFDFRLHGSNKGYKFGRGVSFAPQSYYASHHCGTTFERSMFRVKVIVVSSHEGNRNTIVPKLGYDTTTNGPKTVYVKYNDDVFYPEYIIKFNHHERSSKPKRGYVDSFDDYLYNMLDSDDSL